MIEETTATEKLWGRRRITLSDLITPGSQTTLRFVVEDVGGDDLVEGGLDDLTLMGLSLDCRSRSIPTPDPPGRWVPLSGLSATSAHT